MTPQTIVRDWHDMPRGARILERPADVMFDIDDVIFPTMASIHDLALKAGLHDGNAPMAWSGWENYTLPDGTPCDPQTYWDLWSDFALAGGYINTEPIPEALEAMQRLYTAGHRIHLVTARGFMNHAEQIRAWTPEWVERFRVPWHTLSFAQDKPAVAQAATAPFVAPCMAGTFTYAIDDSPRNWHDLMEAGTEAYLLNHEHNADFDYDWGLPELNESNVWRLDTVTEFVDIITREDPK